jgi:DNA-binding CsgD family transcriptional regulator
MLGTATDDRQSQARGHSCRFGIKGVNVEPGDHVCFFYSGVEQRDAVLLPYLREGVDAGEKCMCAIDSVDPATITARVAESVSADRPLVAELLSVHRAHEVYLRNGRFSKDVVISYLDAVMMSLTRDQQFPLVRGAGEMTWVLGEQVGVEELFDYEHAINFVAPKYPQVLLCMYDISRFGEQMLINAIKTHPKLLIGEALVESPLYQSCGTGAQRRALEPSWDELTDREAEVAVSVSAGLTNRQVASSMNLSRFTIDFHLRQIYRKMGITSRVELTRTVLEHHIG